VQADREVIDTGAGDGSVVLGRTWVLRTRPGKKELRALGQGVYQLVGTGDILRCDDPNAP
jgi:hypothetical protein